MESISLKQARLLVLSSQKLIGTKVDPLQILQHLGYVQIDTISVVQRAHHHVFWTRDNSYRPGDLDQLVENRQAFEYWSHAASYLPMTDYRFSFIRKKAYAERKKTWSSEDKRIMKQVLKRIQQEGPLRSKDFKAEQTKSLTGWWDWKPAKRALERLFMLGELDVARREGFQKVYDLPERVVPSHVDTSQPTISQYVDYLIRRTLRHHGIATSKEIGYLEKGAIVKVIDRRLKELALDNQLVALTVEGGNEVYYAAPKALDCMPRSSSKTLILSPFDNLIIQRKKLKRLFDFDYQIECYVPQAKRCFGYFTLPVFCGATPIARIDCKADRSTGQLKLQSVHYEAGVDKDMFQPYANAKLKAFAKFNDCREISI